MNEILQTERSEESKTKKYKRNVMCEEAENGTRTSRDIDGAVGRSAVQDLSSRGSVYVGVSPAVHLNEPVGELHGSLRFTSSCKYNTSYD